MEAYPEIALRLVLTDRVLNTVEEGIDVSIRIGALPDSSMVATRIGSIRLVVCGSPGYFAGAWAPEETRRPSRPRLHHRRRCSHSDGLAIQARRRAIVTPIRSRLCVNTSEAAVEAAIAGAGLARVMSYKMEAARRAAMLAVVLDTFEPDPFPVHIVYAQRKPAPLKLRAFLNWATPRLKARLAPETTADGHIEVIRYPGKGPGPPRIPGTRQHMSNTVRLDTGLVPRLRGLWDGQTDERDTSGGAETADGRRPIAVPRLAGPRAGHSPDRASDRSDRSRWIDTRHQRRTGDREICAPRGSQIPGPVNAASPS